MKNSEVIIMEEMIEIMTIITVLEITIMQENMKGKALKISDNQDKNSSLIMNNQVHL